ncbi:MAG: phenylalanine ammonia-lyase [Deltaproteobacteria bacterium RIFOXYB12_FULL_58_9]|nr:MAG: phenylalanine ammonia-lyase [Deltaproteobacteria bacterium RIFOXYB12_FULL_58_9]
MAVVVGDKRLTIEDVVRVARYGATVELSAAARERIVRCRTMLKAKIAAGEVMYGVNTGIGELADVALNDDEVQKFQRYLIYNHAAGIGAPAPIEHVRAAMLSRISVHSHGHSGCRPEITETYVAMLNAGITPVVCEKGSVGACGDLAPMSQVALSLMGEGECFYTLERMPTAKAMKLAGIPIPGLQERDGLAAINGSNLIHGIGCLFIWDVERWIKQAEIAAAMSLEALMANMRPYEEELHQLRGFPGAVTCAKNLRKVMNGSDLWTGKIKVKVQDAYSMRSSPQVMGALRDVLAFARTQFEIELNGVADNPVFLPEEDRVLTGANFQGTPLSMPLDIVAAGVTMVCVLSERRLNRLLNPNISVGLPPFLTKGAGMFSGLMLSQYTADTLIVEQRILSLPSCIQSIPAAADQEDFVSMGMNGALKAKQILDCAFGILGIEFIAAAQALDFRDFTPGRGTRTAHRIVREVVEHLDEDRPLFKDHNAMKEAVEECLVLEAVEDDIGELGTSWPA